MGIFERYAPFVQDFIYDHAWENLRGIQVAAGEAIFNTDENVLLTASTASGKTEAAFFPILTDLWENPPSSVGALYVAPLKALINDQFMRLNDLCEEADIPVWHWHGDVSSSHKQKLLKHPSGILQITPESLEALLMHRHMAVPRLFHDLRFVVIDEVHSLLRGDRGGQTLCLVERLSRMAGVNPRRIGLSATIGDPERTGAFLSSGTGRGCIIPRFEEPGRTWRLSMEHFYLTGPQAVERAATEMPKRADGAVEADVLSVERVEDTDETLAPGAKVSLLEAGETLTPDAGIPPAGTGLAPRVTDTAPENADPGIGYIFERTRGHKCLVFVNSREEAEAVCTMLRSYCEAEHEPDRFLIHHGNLSASLRESAEDIMRDDERLDTTVTTATLELGIDIGRLERAFQIDAPFTVSSFLQRMGRTGRRGAPPEMHFVMREEQPEPRTTMPETIPWKLLQGIALVQLTREEHWVEPPRLDRLPYSLLYHQTMATLASCGELTPAELAARVLTLSYFHRVSADDFRVLLRHLLETEQIQQTEASGLIVGLAGERITNSFKFYAVFQENEEFTVRSESAELGTIVNPPPPGERIAIAGACWLVEEVDWKRHLVYCTQVKGRVPAYFGDCAGDIDTHVLERMRRVLAEHEAYPYLLDNARARLRQARWTAEQSGAATQPLINLGGDTWVLFPWLGSYAFLALERLLKIKCAGELGLRGLDPARPYYIQFRMRADEDTFWSVLETEAEKDFDPLDLVYPGEVPYFDKYDELLPAELVRKGFAEGVLDIEGMRARVREWCAARRG
ncbi:DEAD/DEAH box helicase [[Collinsella] massiliensis]|uniref:ATP-dependent helicase n=1 Tax=[Collinsella] massiliensis TaxID=1232426 RepID=A0A1Y3XUX2_9ACTN|nr:DEAD/DEAH box helicase [[Collinsella] massiliensis]OUN89386.1 ATP-dependent helicase [[Collinsella] massiliensis]